MNPVMEEQEILEKLEDYKNDHSTNQLVELLKNKLVEELRQMPAQTDRRRHDLNLLIRELEEELDWIENEKLAEFDPEQQ